MKALSYLILLLAPLASSHAETVATARAKLDAQYCYDHQRWLSGTAADAAALAVSAKKFSASDFLDVWYWTCDARLAGQLAERAQAKTIDLKTFSAVINDTCLYRSKSRNELALQAASLIGSGQLSLQNLQAQLHAQVCDQRTGPDAEKKFRLVLKKLSPHHGGKAPEPANTGASEESAE